MVLLLYEFKSSLYRLCETSFLCKTLWNSYYAKFYKGAQSFTKIKLEVFLSFIHLPVIQ